MNKTWLKQLIYNSGDIFLPERVKKILSIDFVGSSKKTLYVSGWSIIHAINGIIAGYIYLYFKWNRKLYILKLLIIHTIWELWQTIIGMAKPYKLTGRSNLIDSLLDTLFFMLGAYIIREYFTSLG